MSAVHCITTGPWRQNGYIVQLTDRAALVIDPGGQTDKFTGLIAELNLAPCAVLNTHAHYDHLGAALDLIEACGVPFYLHGADATLLRQANLYKALFGGADNIRIPTAFADLASLGGTLTLAGVDIEVIGTPGHTKGSSCFRIGDHFFSGDTLLPNGLGRTDLPGGSAADMAESLAKIAGLPGHLTVYPGHGAALPLAQALAKVHARSNTV